MLVYKKFFFSDLEKKDGTKFCDTRDAFCLTYYLGVFRFGNEMTHFRHFRARRQEHVALVFAWQMKEKLHLSLRTMMQLG